MSYIPFHQPGFEPEPPELEGRLCIECGYRGGHAFGCPATPDDDETEETEETDHDDDET